MVRSDTQLISNLLINMTSAGNFLDNFIEILNSFKQPKKSDFTNKNPCRFLNILLQYITRLGLIFLNLLYTVFYPHESKIHKHRWENSTVEYFMHSLIIIEAKKNEVRSV